MIGIWRCRGLLYPPFPKEHARDRVPLFAERRSAGVEPAFRPSRAHEDVKADYFAAPKTKSLTWV
jgi:hypothetical protein